jgi:hypothetical protein
MQYERLGYDIQSIGEARYLDVAVPDRLVPGFRKKWIAVSGGTGFVTASTGLAGLVADIPTLIANSLMAIGTIGSLYGFDMSDEYEQAFATAILFTRDRDDRATEEAVNRLHRLADRFYAELNSGAESEGEEPRWLPEAARELTWYLVKRQLASVIPGIGSIVSGGVNAQFTSHTCNRARRVYHERFVMEDPPVISADPVEDMDCSPEPDGA